MEDGKCLQELVVEVQRSVDAYVHRDDVENYKQLQIKLKRLQVASSKPVDTLSTFRLQIIENSAITMLLEMGVLQALVARKEPSATAAELATATSCNELVIIRLMRVASALLFCEEMDEATYRANDLTSLLVKPGWIGALQWAETAYPIATNIRRFISSTGYANTGDPSAPPAFDFAHDKSMWKVLEEQPSLRRSFNLWMRERRQHEERSWHKRFPPCASLTGAVLKKDLDAILLVDVGGANGSQAIDFKTTFPHLPGKYVLQDISYFTSGDAGEGPEGVEIMAYDFFTPQPKKGARYYYFRNVFHNWSDEKSAEILRNLIPAMDPDYSSLLIDDFVLPSKETQLRGAVEDILMMVYLNALERTLKQYERLLQSLGLEIINIFSAGANEEAIIEARIRK